MNEFHGILQGNTAKVGVVGLGYVGLPLSLVFHECGLHMLGFDVDAKKVAALQAGESYIRHIGAERIRKALANQTFQASSDFSRLGECDAILVCVPTPLGQHREPDNSFIHTTARQIARTLRRGQLVVLESTTYPGTTDEEVLPILEAAGMKCPDDFLLAFSPEREDPGNDRYTTKKIPKIIGGVNQASTEAAVALYRRAFDRVVPVSSARVAESCKLLENIFRSVNIALVNELKITFEKMGINVWEVIEGAKTKPFGFMPFYPGPGLGGHCIPIDPFYLTWKAAEFGAWTRFIELAGEINTAMPVYVVSRVTEALNEDGKSVRGASVLVLGLAYKSDIDDDRESPSYEILEILREKGARVAYCDPYLPEMKRTRRHDFDMKSVPCTAESFAGYDVVIVSTAHRVFVDPGLYEGVKLLVDTRNMQLVFRAGAGPRIVRA